MSSFLSGSSEGLGQPVFSRVEEQIYIDGFVASHARRCSKEESKYLKTDSEATLFWYVLFSVLIISSYPRLSFSQKSYYLQPKGLSTQH